MATHSSVLAWRIPGTEEPRGLLSMGSQRVGHDWSDLAAAAAAAWASLVAQLVKNPPAMRETWVWSLGWEDPLEKGKVTTPVFWPGESHGLYSPWGHRESNTTKRLSLHFTSPPQYFSFLFSEVSSSHENNSLKLKKKKCLLEFP